MYVRAICIAVMNSHHDIWRRTAGLIIGFDGVAVCWNESVQGPIYSGEILCWAGLTDKQSK